MAKFERKYGMYVQVFLLLTDRIFDRVADGKNCQPLIHVLDSCLIWRSVISYFIAIVSPPNITYCPRAIATSFF